MLDLLLFSDCMAEAACIVASATTWASSPRCGMTPRIDHASASRGMSLSRLQLDLRGAFGGTGDCQQLHDSLLQLSSLTYISRMWSSLPVPVYA